MPKNLHRSDIFRMFAVLLIKRETNDITRKAIKNSIRAQGSKN